jgi:dihydroflavonol-4-reductase
MNDTVLVTGVSGYVGQHCAAELLRRGSACAVRCGTRTRRTAVRRAGSRASHRSSGSTSSRWTSSPTPAGTPRWRAAATRCTSRRPTSWSTSRAGVRAHRARGPGDAPGARGGADAGVERVVVTSSVVAMNGHMTRGTFGPDDWTDLEAPNLKRLRPEQDAGRARRLGLRAGASGRSGGGRHQPGRHLRPDPDRRRRRSVAPSGSPRCSGARCPCSAASPFTMVDVRDVARLHVRAMTTPAAAGQRYVAASRSPSRSSGSPRSCGRTATTKVSTRTVPDSRRARDGPGRPRRARPRRLPGEGRGERPQRDRPRPRVVADPVRDDGPGHGGVADVGGRGVTRRSRTSTFSRSRPERTAAIASSQVASLGGCGESGQ